MMGITKKIKTIADVRHADYGYEMLMYDINDVFIQLIFNEDAFVNSIAYLSLHDEKIKEKFKDMHMYPYTTDGKLFGEEEETNMDIKDEKNPSAGISDTFKNDLNKRFGIPTYGTYDKSNAIPDSDCQCDTAKNYDSFIYNTFRSALNAGKLDKAVNHPDHYNTGNYECIDVMEEVFGRDGVMDFCLCNAFKYIYRCLRKDNTEEDLEKAEWYLHKLNEMIKEDEKWTTTCM